MNRNSATSDFGTSNVPAGGSDAEIAFKFLINNGLTANQAAGIVGNLMAETGGGTFDLNPTALNSIGAYGIVQWMGGRKSSLMQKPNYTSLETQINWRDRKRKWLCVSDTSAKG